MRKLTIVLTTLLAACASNSPDTLATETLQQRIQREFHQALAAKDYRLYAFSGRRVILPGLSAEQMRLGQAQCGTKFMPGSGDVLSNEQQKTERRDKFNFASGYNQLMLEFCLAQ